MPDTQLLIVMHLPKDICHNFYVDLQFSKFHCSISLLVFIFANTLIFLNNCMTSYSNKKTLTRKPLLSFTDFFLKVLHYRNLYKE